MKITVTGTGYVGLVTGICLSEIGHEVTCIDVDTGRIDKLEAGICPIYEPGLQEMLSRNRGNLSFTTDYAKVYKASEVIFICVGTPEKKDGSANLVYIYEALKQIVENIANDCVVVIKSTVPVSTGDKLERYIKHLNKKDNDIEIVSNPEFLSQGTAIKDTMNASRIVLGLNSQKAERSLKNIYDPFKQKYIVTDRKSAELIKYASNNFLALKISYINEIANLCDITGANIDDVAKGMGLDARIGDKFLKAGIGFGGSCFPKDTKALNWLANFNDSELKTIRATIDVNENQKVKLLKKARKYYDSFRGLNVAILGLTFKPGTDDLREAPSLQNIPILLEDGAKIKAWDPVGSDNYRKYYPDEIEYCSSITEALKASDICFIFTEWPEIVNMDIRDFSTYMRNPIVLDGRNCYKIEAADNMGFVYESIGRRIVGEEILKGSKDFSTEKAG